MPTTTERRAVIMADLPRHLRMLADYVERLSLSRNPETFAAMKDEIAKTLVSLATVIENDRRERAPDGTR